MDSASQLFRYTKKTNQGFSLAIILVLVSILSVIGVSMLRSTLLQGQMALSLTHSQLALHQTQSAAALLDEPQMWQGLANLISQPGYHDTFSSPHEGPTWTIDAFDESTGDIHDTITISIPNITGQSKNAQVFIERLYQSDIHDALNDRFRAEEVHNYVRATIRANEGAEIAILQVVYKLTYIKALSTTSSLTQPDDITLVSRIQIR